MHHQDHSIPQPPSNMLPPRSPQIDPALSLYPGYYSYQQQPQQHMASHHLIPPNLPSPSSQGSDTAGTPPAESMSYPSSSANRKRPSSALPPGLVDTGRKKVRTDRSTDGASPSAEKEEAKPKSTRGPRCDDSHQWCTDTHSMFPAHVQCVGA